MDGQARSPSKGDMPVDESRTRKRLDILERSIFFANQAYG